MPRIEALNISHYEAQTPEIEGLVRDPKMYGIEQAGITKSLLSECERLNLSVSVLLQFCFEGDNISDSVQMASIANSTLQLVSCDKQGII